MIKQFNRIDENKQLILDNQENIARNRTLVMRGS